MDQRPLEGLRIIEISSFVASPLGGMTLAHLGAEVIRIDPIGGAADLNRWPIDAAGHSLYWPSLNQGKRSVTVDFRSDEGTELVAELIAASGPEGGIVLTNGASRGVLSYDELGKRRPDLIHVQLQGRRAGGTAVDYTVNAASGFAYLTGSEGTPPVNNVLPAWDLLTGLYLALGLLAADRKRARTGAGAQITVALDDVALATTGNLGLLAEAQLNAQPRPRIGNATYGDYGEDFTTADGARIIVLTLTPRHFTDLVAAADVETEIKSLASEVGADFAQASDRYRNRDAISALLRPWFESRTYEEVAGVLATKSMQWSRYQTLRERVQELPGNPLLSPVTQPGIGSFLAPGSPLVFGQEQIPPALAPTLGQHTDEVLGQLLSHTPDHIADLRKRGVVA